MNNKYKLILLLLIFIYPVKGNAFQILESGYDKIGVIVAFSILFLLIIVAFVTWCVFRYTRKLANKARQEEAEKWLLMDSLSVGVAIYDKDGHQRYINSAFASIFGIENKEEHLKKQVCFFDDNLATNEIKEKVRLGENVDVTLAYDFKVAADNKYFSTIHSHEIDIECKITYIRNNKNEVEKIILIVRNIMNSLKMDDILMNMNTTLEGDSISNDKIEVDSEILSFEKTSKFLLDKMKSGMVYLSSDLRVLWENVSQVFPLEYTKGVQVYKPGFKCNEGLLNTEGFCEDCVVIKAVKEKGICHRELTLANGRVIKTTAIPLYNDANKHRGTILRLDDITEQRQMADELDKLKIILEKSNSALVYITADFIVRWENLSTTNLFPQHIYKEGELCYSSAYCLEEPCENCSMKRAMESHKVEIKEIESEDGRTIEVIASPVFTQDGKEFRGIVSQFIDITEHKNINKELMLAKEKAEQSDVLKSAFLANMSHEIRTPLNAIVGFSELLKDTEDVEEKAEFWNIISANNELLLRLIGDILDLSKIESGMLEFKIEKFNLSSLFDEVYATMLQRNTNLDVELIEENPYENCFVTLDKNRLNQVGMNFVTNAIKYTPKGKVVMGYQYVDNGIKLYVRDTGIGIAKEKQHRLFQRFEKLDDFAQGTGLGLSICKAIVLSCDGKIGFESEENKGSYFWAWFPCEAEFEEKKKISKSKDLSEDDNFSLATRIDNIPFKILVAEDCDSNFLLIGKILKKCNIKRAENGLEAVEMLQTEKFDVIFMDMKMPVMGGIEATRKIREFDTKTPIVAITANAFDIDRAKALDAGCNAFIAKPLRKHDLLKIMGGGGVKSLLLCDSPFIE